MRRPARFVAMIALVMSAASLVAVEPSRLSLVPWKVLRAGESVDAAMVLFWIPGSNEELRRSRLLTSKALRVFSGRCVAMRIVRYDDTKRLAALDAHPAAPEAVLVAASGDVLARTPSDDVAAIERMVLHALDEREERAENLLDEARGLAETGDVVRAEEIYDDLWEDRCACPRQGRDAQKALKKLRRRR